MKPQPNVINSSRDGKLIIHIPIVDQSHNVQKNVMLLTCTIHGIDKAFWVFDNLTMYASWCLGAIIPALMHHDAYSARQFYKLKVTME